MTTSQMRRVVRTELLRSIAWFGLGLVGWPVVVAEVSWLDATPLTVFGLPVVTWAVLTACAVGVRAATAGELRVRTPAGLSVWLLSGVALGGVGAVYLATAGGYPPAVTAAAYVAVTGATVLWYWYARLPERVSEPTA